MPNSLCLVGENLHDTLNIHLEILFRPSFFVFSEGFEQGRGGGARGFENLLCFKWPITPEGKGEGARGHKRLIQYGMAELCV